MNLNMHIICQALRDLDIEQRVVSAPHTMLLRCPAFVTKDHHLPSDMLNIVRAKEAQDFSLEASGPVSLLFDGPPPQRILDNPVLDIAWTKTPVGTNTLMNRCSEAFAFCQEWVSELYSLLSKNAPLRRLGERSCSIFENPIWLMDKDFNVIFSSHVYNWGLPAWYRLKKEGDTLPLEEVDRFNVTHAALPRNMRIPYQMALGQDHSALCYDIIIADDRVATLVVDGVRRAVSKADHSFLKVLGDIISRNLNFNARFEKQPSIALSSVMEQLLEGDVPSSKLTMALAAREWSLDDPYLCCSTCSSNGGSYPDNVLAPIAARVCDDLADTVFCISNKHIVFVSNLHSIEEDVQAIPRQLLTAMNKQGLQPEIGVSGVFGNFASLCVFKEQADDALQLGMEQGSGEIHHFEDFLEESFKRRCLRGTVPEAFAPPGLIRIRRHDSQYGTSLEEVLRTYVEYSYSVGDTAKALRMHRNTITARLQKIQEVGRLDLEDRNTRVLLSVAFLVDE